MQLRSRTFQLRISALSMVPVADMMNHDPADENQIEGTVGNTYDFRLIAGRDIKKGEEVGGSVGQTGQPHP